MAATGCSATSEKFAAPHTTSDQMYTAPGGSEPSLRRNHCGRSRTADLALEVAKYAQGSCQDVEIASLALKLPGS